MGQKGKYNSFRHFTCGYLEANIQDSTWLYYYIKSVFSQNCLGSEEPEPQIWTPGTCQGQSLTPGYSLMHVHICQDLKVRVIPAELCAVFPTWVKGVGLVPLGLDSRMDQGHLDACWGPESLVLSTCSSRVASCHSLDTWTVDPINVMFHLAKAPAMWCRGLQRACSPEYYRMTY